MTTYKQIKKFKDIKEANSFCFENENVISITPVTEQYIDSNGSTTSYIVIYQVRKRMW